MTVIGFFQDLFINLSGVINFVIRPLGEQFPDIDKTAPAIADMSILSLFSVGLVGFLGVLLVIHIIRLFIGG